MAGFKSNVFLKLGGLFFLFLLFFSTGPLVATALSPSDYLTNQDQAFSPNNVPPTFLKPTTGGQKSSPTSFGPGENLNANAVVTILTPAPNAFLKGTVPFIARVIASDPIKAPVTKVFFFRYSGASNPPTEKLLGAGVQNPLNSSIWALSEGFNTTAEADSDSGDDPLNYRLYVVAHTNNPNPPPATVFFGSSEQRLVTIDNHEPVVTLKQPADGAKLSGRILVEVEVDDINLENGVEKSSGIQTLDFYIDNKLVRRQNNRTFPKKTTFKFNWFTDSHTDGNHTLKAVAYDRARNSGTATITVDTQNPPMVYITKPKDGDFVGGKTTVLVRAIDADGVNKVDLLDYGFVIDTKTTPSSGTSFDGEYKFVVDTTNIPRFICPPILECVNRGLLQLTAKAYQANGTFGVSPVVTAIIDNTPPKVTIISPDGGIVDGVVAIKVEAYDKADNGEKGSGLAFPLPGIEFFVNGNKIGAVYGRSIDTSTGQPIPFTYNWDTSKYPDGKDVLTASAQDKRGNKGISQPVTVQVSHQSGPTLNCSITGGCRVSVSCQVSDPSGIKDVSAVISHSFLPSTPATCRDDLSQSLPTFYLFKCQGPISRAGPQTAAVEVAAKNKSGVVTTINRSVNLSNCSHS